MKTNLAVIANQVQFSYNRYPCVTLTIYGNYHVHFSGQAFSSEGGLFRPQHREVFSFNNDKILKVDRVQLFSLSLDVTSGRCCTRSSYNLRSYDNIYKHRQREGNLFKQGVKLTVKQKVPSQIMHK